MHSHPLRRSPQELKKMFLRGGGFKTHWKLTTQKSLDMCLLGFSKLEILRAQVGFVFIYQKFNFTTENFKYVFFKKIQILFLVCED